MAEISKENKKLFAKFLSENKILIADPSHASRARLANIMIQLGAKAAYIKMHGTYESAIEDLKESLPRVVLCDYYLGRSSGFDLIVEYKNVCPIPKDSIFMLVTGNSSQSAVARAAEEDIDGFILKPYTLESLAQSITSACVQKLFPTPYVQAVNAGKDALFKLEFTEAKAHFSKAMTLHDKPALAHFYYGETVQMEEAIAAAQESYNTGLSFNSIHYKCLVALHDLLMKDDRVEEVYDIVKRIAKFFPANPKRLSSVIRLAIRTSNYNDIDRFYDIFKELEERPPELTKAICAGLIVAGRHDLNLGAKDKALKTFDKVAVSMSGQAQFLLYIIEALTRQGLFEECAPYFKRFDPSQFATPEYKVAQFLLEQKELQPIEIVNKGMALYREGYKSPEAYRVLIEGLKSTQRMTEYEEVKAAMVQNWPLQADLYGVA